MTDSLKQLVEQYLGVTKPVIPSSGDAAEDYDRRNAWYANARAKILAQLPEAMPHIIEHLEKADNLLRRIGLDALPVALPLIAARADSQQKAIRLGQILSGRVTGLFEATSSYTTADHPEPVRATAVYLLSQIDHPMREETLRQLAQSGSTAVQQAAQNVLGQTGASGDTLTKEAAGMTYTFPADLPDLLENLRDDLVQQRLSQTGADAIPAIMYAIAEYQYSAYREALVILEQMAVDNLPQQMEPYVQPEQPPLVQAAALHTMAHYPDYPGLLAHLRRALTDATHGQIQQEALEALSDVGSSEEIALIVPLLESTNGRTRTLAGLTLVDLGDLRGAPTVYMQAESKYPGVRLQAVRRLPAIDTQEARQHLKRLTDDEDERVREAARQASR